MTKKHLQAFLCTLKKKKILNPKNPVANLPSLSFPARDDQPGGGQEPGQVLPDAAPGQLPRGTARDHDDVLEAEARGAAHF